MAKVILFFPIIKNEKTHLLPLSVLLIAAPLVKQGYSIEVIDQRTEPNWRKKLLNELKKSPLLVGISVLTGQQILYGLEVSQLVKQKSNALVVWGGVHPSLLPKQTLANRFVDLVAIGEGEETLLELVKRLDKKQNYQDILGIGYKKDKKIHINTERDFINLDKQPTIPYHLIDLKKYIQLQSFTTGKPSRNLAVYTSRGCPHQCAFCYNKEFNQRKWRGQSAERVVEEIIKLVRNYQITSFNIQDDEFFTDLERVRKICRMLLSKNIKAEFISSCRIDYICRMDEDFLRLVSQAGFKILELGVESGSPKILQMIKKDIEVNQVSEAVKRIKKFNIEGKYCFMVGFPKEKIGDIWQTTDLMREIKKINPYSRIPAWRIFTPFPGTDLYQAAVENGWDPPQNLEEWANYDFNTIKMPWLNKQKEKIIENVAYLAKFLRLQDKPLPLSHLILGKWIDFRWQNHLFSFLPERKIIDLVIKLKRKIV